MVGPIEKSNFHVLVIGAGSVGLLIAQRLKTLGIRCTVFEQERHLNQRPRDWSFGIYWAQNWLTECLPSSLHSKLYTAQVDPSKTVDPDDYIRLLNGKTAEELTAVPTPKLYRLMRSRFRVLLSEGIDVQYGKRLKKISETTHEDGATATAIFEDGSKATGNLLVGADGAKSVVRQYLFGPEIAALQPLPIIGLHATYTFPPEVADKMAAEMQGQVTLLTYHPMGCCAFFPIQSVSDHELPQTWSWLPTLTFRHELGQEAFSNPAESRSAWNQRAEHFAEPFRSALLSLPPETEIWCERLAQWPTIKWDKSGGSVTLAGDSAHPMTYHRGQGLNNGVHDACTLCRALEEHFSEGKPLSEAMAVYEEELVERGRDAVISSGQNSLMLMDWEQLMKAEIFKQGLIGHAKREA